MKLTIKSLAALGSIMLLAGCSDDNPFANLGEGEGLIHPRVTSDATVIDAKPTRDQEQIAVPDAKDFSVTLTSSSGKSNHWDSLQDFPTDKGFAIGEYTLEVNYGNVEIEGLNSPCFYGSAMFTVRPDEIAEPSVSAALINSMVSVEYTDAFKTYFQEYSLVFHSEGHGYPTLLQGEDGPLYVAPGNVEITLEGVRHDGKGVTLQPAKFTAEARHHYHMRLDVNGGQVGTAALEITFDDSLADENVEIDLSEELMNTPGPEVEGRGFADGGVVSILKGRDSANLVYNIFAFAGIQEAKFNVQSTSYTLPLGSSNEVNLAGLDASQQAVAAANGINCRGLYKNVDKIATVDFSALTGNLPEGAHTFSMVVKDKYTRVNQPVSVTVNVVGLTLEVVSISSIPQGATQAVITVTYNGATSDATAKDDLIKDAKFEVYSDAGVYVAAPIVDVTPATRRTREGMVDAFPVKNYDVTISLPSCGRSEIPVKLNGKEAGNIIQRELEYNVEANAYTKKVVLKVVGDDASVATSAVNFMRVFVDGTEVAKSRLTRDASAHTVTVSGLTPATIYNIQTTASTGSSPNMATTTAVTTETELGVPNGDFEELTAEYSGTLQQGGRYRRTYLGTSYTSNTQEFAVSRPTGWGTTNGKTFGAGAPENSWFKTFSVFNSSLTFVSHEAKISGLGGNNYDRLESYNQTAQNGSNAMVLRNVGWNNSGTVPSDFTNTAATPGRNYFSQNAPSALLKAAGKLFLGSYSYSDGVETFNEGVDFASRPLVLSGYYKYMPDSNDSAECGRVTVTLLNGSTVIATATKDLSAASDFTKFDLPLNYVSDAKATTLRIKFSSSNRSDESSIKLTERKNYLQEAYGAVLVVDNLSFTY